MGELEESSDGDLRSDPELAEGIVETSPVGIAVVDAEGEVTFANSRAEEIYGRSREDLDGFTHDDPRWDLVDEDGETLETGAAPFDRVVASEAAIYDQVVGIRRPTGERVWVSVNGAPRWNEDGELQRVVFAFEDVTERKQRERELARYETLFEESKDVNVIVEPDGTFRYLTPSAENVFGYEPEELIGEVGFDYIHPEDRERAVSEFAKMIESPDYEPRIEFRFEHQDGSWIVLEALARDLRDDPDIEGVVVYTRNITDIRERERELERALVLLNKTERIADVAGWEVDPETEAPYWSDHMFNLLDVDYDEQPTLDQALDVYHSEADRAVVEDAVEEALETGDPFDVETRFPRPSGDVGWLRVKGDPEVEDGEVVSLRGAVQDVTERKRREQALQESRNQLRALIDVLPVAVFVAEADGEIVEWNEAAEEIWGGKVVESESVAEYDQYEAWWADTGEPVDPEEWPLARALEGEEVTDPDEIQIKGFDGKLRTVLNHGMPVRGADGEVSRAVVTLVDITERKEYQRRLEESNERLEQFAHAASHDLQEPLRMVSSYLQLLENRYGDELDAVAEEFIDFAVDGADRMREMIDGLLQYSRVDTQGDPFEPVALEGVLEDVRQDLQVKIEESDAEITAGDLPTVYGDDGQLNQVFQNLLSNAIEYSGEGPPRIELDAERAGEEWVVSVSDDGIGIDPENADKVFEVFESLQGPDDAGTGIGLALVERIVERHGGDIWVESEPGEGATFSFTLPAVPERERDRY